MLVSGHRTSAVGHGGLEECPLTLHVICTTSWCERLTQACGLGTLEQAPADCVVTLDGWNGLLLRDSPEDLEPDDEYIVRPKRQVWG